MATLTINFTTDPSAVKYRIKYRKTGTSTYTTIETTTSPATVTGILCGEDYEGTVQAICSEGIPCDRYRISTTDPAADGDAFYDDCATGNSASQAITGSGDFYVCSRTEPVIQGSSSTSVTKVSAGTCVSPSPEEASGPAYWTATGTTCPTNYVVYSCGSGGTGDSYIASHSGGTLVVGQAVKLSIDGGAGCWEITGTTTDAATATVLNAFADCNSCAS